MGRELIAYHSRRGQNLVGGKLQNLTVGNTELAAELIRVFIQGDLFRIEPVRDYPPDFCPCIDQARQDLLRVARLELRAWPENWMKYETVYLGYPNHWNTLPVPVLSFVEGLDRQGRPPLLCPRRGRHGLQCGRTAAAVPDRPCGGGPAPLRRGYPAQPGRH